MNMTAKKFTRIKRDILKKDIRVTSVTTKVTKPDDDADHAGRGYARVDIDYVNVVNDVDGKTVRSTYRFRIPLNSKPGPHTLDYWCKQFDTFPGKSLSTMKFGF